MANKLQLSLMGGMNRKAGPLIIKDDECELCLNYILDNVGTLQKRGGYAGFGGIPVANRNVDGLYSFTDSSASTVVNLMVADNNAQNNGVIYALAGNTFTVTLSNVANLLMGAVSLKPAVSGVSPVILGSPTSATSNSASSLTFSFGASAGTNTMLVVSVSATNAGSAGIPSGVTFNGVAMERAFQNAPSSGFAQSIWILVAPASVTANVVVTFTGTVEAIICGAQMISGVSQVAGTGPVRATANTAILPSATSGSLTVTGSGSSDFLFGLFTNDTNRTQTQDPGQTNVTNATATSAAFADTFRATLNWKTPGLWTAVKTNDTVAKRTRFFTFVDYVFRVNGSDVVASSADGYTWGTTNAPLTITPNYGAVFQDRGYTAHGGASNKSRVWFSSLPSSGSITWDLTNDWFDVNPDDGDEITALENNGNRLLIFKHRALYRWTFGQVDPDRVIGTGTDSQESVKTNFDLGITFFANQRGVYAYTGNRPKLISRKIQPFIDAVSNWTTVYGGVDNDHYYLYVGTMTVDGRTYTKTVLCYHISLDAWSIFSVGHTITIFASLLSVGFGEQLCLGASDGGTALTSFELNPANGTAPYTSDVSATTVNITAEFISKEYVLSFPKRTNLTWIDIFAMRQGNTMAYYDLDRQGIFQELAQVTQRVTNIRIPNRECNTVRIKTQDVGTASAQQSSTFEGFNMEHMPKEKRDENTTLIKKPGYGQ